MGFREHVRQNRLAISTCFVSLLCAGGIVYRMQQEPPRPLPRPRPPAPTNKLAVRPLQTQEIEANAEQGIAGLTKPYIIMAHDKKLLTAYFVATNPTAAQPQLMQALQLAWQGLRPQLTDAALTEVHFVAVRTAPTITGAQPPPTGDTNVLAHGHALRDQATGNFPETLTK